MQTVWSRSPRPQRAYRSLANSTSRLSVPSRRTTTSIFRKKVTAGDAFGALLVPVLGGAYIIDAKAKERQRSEWEDQIAAVQEETQRIRRAGSDTYAQRTRRKNTFPPLARSYSTAAACIALTDGLEDEIQASERLLQPEHNTLRGQAGLSAQAQVKSAIEPKQMELCQRLQRLVAMKLTVRMALHIQFGKSPRFTNRSSHSGYDEAGPPPDVNELLSLLKRIRKLISVIHKADGALPWYQYQIETRSDVISALDDQIHGLSVQFDSGRIVVSQLIERLSQAIFSSRDSPSSSGYNSLMRTFCRLGLDHLAHTVEGAMREARISIDPTTVNNMIQQSGKNREAGSLDQLIKDLTSDGAIARFGERWYWEKVNHILVPNPPGQRPGTLSILIYAALKCGQLHRANAWFAILARNKRFDSSMPFIIASFLAYFSANRDWTGGYFWLRYALDQAEDLGCQSIRQLQRVIFAMLKFAGANDDRVLYRNILGSAVQARLGVFTTTNDLTLPRPAADILQEWNFLHQSTNSTTKPELHSGEKAILFKQKLSYLYEFTDHDHEIQSQLYSGSFNHGQVPWRASQSPGDWRESSVPEDSPGQPEVGMKYFRGDSGETEHWKELCRRQQEQLDLLRSQLNHQMTSIKTAHEGMTTSPAEKADMAVANSRSASETGKTSVPAPSISNEVFTAKDFTQLHSQPTSGRHKLLKGEEEKKSTYPQDINAWPEPPSCDLTLSRTWFEAQAEIEDEVDAYPTESPSQSQQAEQVQDQAHDQAHDQDQDHRPSNPSPIKTIHLSGAEHRHLRLHSQPQDSGSHTMDDEHTSKGSPLRIWTTPTPTLALKQSDWPENLYHSDSLEEEKMKNAHVNLDMDVKVRKFSWPPSKDGKGKKRRIRVGRPMGMWSMGRREWVEVEG